MKKLYTVTQLINNVSHLIQRIRVVVVLFLENWKVFELIINLNYILDWFGLVQRKTQKLFSKIIDGTPATLDKIKLISKEILRLKLVVQNEVMDFFLHDNLNVDDLMLMLNIHNMR